MDFNPSTYHSHTVFRPCSNPAVTGKDYSYYDKEDSYGNSGIMNDGLSVGGGPRPGGGNNGGMGGGGGGMGGGPGGMGGNNNMYMGGGGGGGGAPSYGNAPVPPKDYDYGYKGKHGKHGACVRFMV